MVIEPDRFHPAACVRERHDRVAGTEVDADRKGHGLLSREGGGALDGECLLCQPVRPIHLASGSVRGVAWIRKKAAVASGPKFREETPKKGSNKATPIAVLHC